MPLSIGDKLGHYQILAPLGAGGMGEVYRAHDTKLERDVAIKVLPRALANDPERLARFDREAKILAALNHSNIAVIYGLVESDAGRALVMELVPGETLGDRIKRGPLPLDEALQLARQIAEALEAAHEKGVVHRDLKPANVMITPAGLVKVLDFGLAAIASGTTRQSGDPDNSPTLTMGMTQAGAIMGTAAYMSPEQAAGTPVDRRADIWSYGVVLWEMLTGKRLFTGDTMAHILAAVLQTPIDFDKLTAPGPIKNLLRRCLDRDVKSRLQAIGEARVAIQKWVADPQSGAEAPLQAESPPHTDKRSTVAWMVAAAVFAVASIALGYIAYRHVAEEPPRVAKLTVLPPEKGEFISNNGPPALSPDGRHIAFIANVDGKTGLWVRDLDSPIPRLLPGTDGATFPFWSPDSRNVGFGAGGKLKKIDVTGGPALTICDAGGLRGASWSKDDVILFALNPAALSRVPAAGGVPTPVTELDKSRNENGHRYPWFLPDGRHFLYMGRSPDSEKTAVFVGDLESKTRKQVLAGDTQAWYAAPVGNSSGYLLFLRDRTLMAQPFDAAKIATTGDAVPVAEQVDHIAANHGTVAVSQNGVLAYISGGGGVSTQIAWFDRSGKAMGTVGAPGNLEWASLSPDGGTVATDRRDPQSGNFDLWLHDLSRGTASRLTFAGINQFPVWSPDGTRIAYLAPAGINVKPATGTGAEETLADSPNRRPTDWSRDGRFIFAGSAVTGDIWVHPLSGDKKPYIYQHSEFRKNLAKLSPDGHWLAYYSLESKRYEVYVVSFPTPEGKWQISTNGGQYPVWSRDGRELYFISADNKMMAVDIKVAPASAGGAKLQASVPKPLFDVRLGATNPNFDVSKDGRFLIPTAAEQSANVPMTVVLNWQAGLKK